MILIFKSLLIDGEERKCLCTSYSQIDMFLSCNQKWYRTYILGNRDEGKSEPLSLGTAVHETMEELIPAICQVEREITIAESHEIFDYHVKKNEIPFTSEESKKEAISQHEEMLANLVQGNNAFAQFIKGKNPVACEMEFHFKIDLPFTVKYRDEEYREIYIVGAIDLILQDEDGNYFVVDYKSGKKPFERKKLLNNLQLPIYAMVVKQKFGKPPKETIYYHTRLDNIQSVFVPAETEDDVVYEYYKNGNLKFKSKTMQEVKDELLHLFRQMYCIGKYKGNPTPLCAWCQFSKVYGDKSCKYSSNFLRSDIPIPATATF